MWVADMSWNLMAQSAWAAAQNSKISDFLGPRVSMKNLHIYIYTYIYIYIYLVFHLDVHTYCIYIYIYMYILTIYVYIYMYICTAPVLHMGMASTGRLSRMNPFRAAALLPAVRQGDGPGHCRIARAPGLAHWRTGAGVRSEVSTRSVGCRFKVTRSPSPVPFSPLLWLGGGPLLILDYRKKGTLLTSLLEDLGELPFWWGDVRGIDPDFQA